MKFYVTTEGIQKLKRSFLNLKLFSVIHIPEILDKLGYTYETIDEYGAFIVSNKINDLIISYSKSKRIRGIIYSNPSINEQVISNLFDTLDPLVTISELVLLDDYHVPKLKHLYTNFDEIIFFPSIKKIRLIEATMIKALSNGKVDPQAGKN